MNQPDWNRINTEWVRKWFFEHPQASVDDAARAASNARHGVSRGVIADVRRDVLAILDKGVTDKPPVAVVSPPFNPPRVVEAAPPPPAEATPAAPRGGYRSDFASQRTREKFVDDYIQEHPLATGTEVKNAVYARFGRGVADKYCCAALLAMREATGKWPPGARLRPKPKEQQPAAAARAPEPVPLPTRQEDIDATLMHAARALKDAMIEGRIRKLVVSMEDLDGKFDVDWSTELHQARKGKASL